MLFLRGPQAVAAASSWKSSVSTPRSTIFRRALLFTTHRHGLRFATERYIEMFGLSPEVAKPGCTMQELIAHRKETGSFDGDVDEFCDAIIRNVALGKATRQITEAPGGRAIQIINQPLDVRRLGGDDRGCHRAHALRRADRPSRALRPADRSAQPGIVSRATRTRAECRFDPASNWRCCISTSTSSRASTTRSDTRSAMNS